MNVLLIDPSDRGGIANYTAMLAEAIRNAGASVSLLGSRGLDAATRPYPVKRSLPVLRWGRPDRRTPLFFGGRAVDWTVGALAVVIAVLRFKPDVVHIQAPLNRRFDRVLVQWIRRRCPVVWTAHDILPFERTTADARWFASIYRNVDAVIVHGPSAAAELRALCGVEPTVIDHPAPAVDPVSRNDARTRLDLPTDERILGALGFIRAYKGYDLLCDVWEKLGNNAPLLLVLGEPLSERDRSAVLRLAEHDRVRLLLRYVPDEQLRLAAAASDALLLPYETASASGIVHLARAVGTPVLASDAPMLAEVVRDTSAGRVLARTVDAWAEAVVGELPPPPPTPAPAALIALAHLELYESLSRRAGESKPDARSEPLRIVAYTDAIERGGAEGSLASLLSSLSSNIDVTVMGVDTEVVDWIASLRSGSKKVVVPPVENKFDLAPILEHVRAVRRSRPHIFHANLRHPWSCQYGILGAAATPGVRIVAVEQSTIWSTSRLQRRLRRVLLTRVDAHVAVGERAARALERATGVRAGTIRVIDHGVADVPTARATSRGGRFVVGAVGRLSPEKGFDVLFHALTRLPATDVSVVGDGPERRALEDLAERLKVADRVSFSGWRDDARSLLGSFDLLVVPSRSEGLPLVVIEAMLAQLAVVASDVGSVADVVSDGQTGLLVPPEDPIALADAIESLRRDSDLRGRMGTRARELALTRFAPEGAARAFESLYRELLDG